MHCEEWQRDVITYCGCKMKCLAYNVVRKMDSSLLLLHLVCGCCIQVWDYHLQWRLFHICSVEVKCFTPTLTAFYSLSASHKRLDSFLWKILKGIQRNPDAPIAKVGKRAKEKNYLNVLKVINRFTLSMVVKGIRVEFYFLTCTVLTGIH